MFWDIANIIFSVVYFYTILTTIIFLLTENRNPVKSIAWILVLVFLPVVGFLCYILVGRKFRKRRIISKRSIRTLRKYEKTTRKDLSELSLTEQQNAIASLAMSNGDASFFEGNSIEIFVKADELYEKILEDIRNARSHINLEYYIFCPDNIGTKIMDALIAKAREGVEIRVVIDDVGSWKFKKKHIKKKVQLITTVHHSSCLWPQNVMVCKLIIRMMHTPHKKSNAWLRPFMFFNSQLARKITNLTLNYKKKCE